MKKTIFILIFLIINACARNPEPISHIDTKKKVDIDLKKITNIKKNDEKNWTPELKIDLYTAITLAVKNNRDLKVKLLESAMANRQIEMVKFDRLPNLAANAGYSFTDKYPASTSSTVTGETAGSIGTSYTTSTSKDINNRDVGFTWNALDFGLSYIRAGQKSDRYLIAQELERKATHNIIRETIRVYWNTISAERLIKKYDPLLKKVYDALDDSEIIEELLLSKPMDALLYQKELLDIQRALQSQKESFINAKIELGALMGLLPQEKYRLIETDDALTVLNMSINEMEEYALLNRPELIENHYEERISREETRASMRSLLPGLKFNSNWNYSSNDYLMNQSNTDYGTSIGLNLLNVFSAPKVKEITKANTHIVEEQRLALSMAVLSQVHLSNVDYALAREEYETSERYLYVAKKITEQVKNAQKIARFGNLEIIREQASLLVAELRNDIAYSKFQHSIAQMFTSVGIDITSKYVKDMDVKEYANVIKNNFNTYGKSYYAKVNKPLNKQKPIIFPPENNSSEIMLGKFSFAKDTFRLQGSGKTRYDLTKKDGSALPRWIKFLPSQRSILVDYNEKDETDEIELIITAKNIDVGVRNKFTLTVDPAAKKIRLAEEKRIVKEKKLAKLKKIEQEKNIAKEKKLAKLKKIEQEKKLAKQKKIIKEKKNTKEKEKQLLAQLKLDKRVAEKNGIIYKSKPNIKQAKKLAKQKKIAAVRKTKEDKKLAKLQKIEDKKLAKQKKVAAVRKTKEDKKLAKLQKIEDKKLAKLQKIEAKKLAKQKKVAAVRKTKEDKKLAKLQKIEAKKLAKQNKKKVIETEKPLKIEIKDKIFVKKNEVQLSKYKITKEESDKLFYQIKFRKRVMMKDGIYSEKKFNDYLKANGIYTFMQVAAFRNIDVAQMVSNSLIKKVDYNVYIKETIKKKPIFFRILIGPIEQELVKDSIKQIESLNIKNYFITQEFIY